MIEGKSKLIFNKQLPIVLCKLRFGQELKLRAYASKGVGKYNSKWSPVSNAVYQYLPNIRINEALAENLTTEQKIQLLESSQCIRKEKSTEQGAKYKLFRLNAISGAIELAEINSIETNEYYEECIKVVEHLFPGLVGIHQHQDKFLFRVEGTGSLRPNEIVKIAINFLLHKLKDLKKEIDK